MKAYGNGYVYTLQFTDSPWNPWVNHAQKSSRYTSKQILAEIEASKRTIVSPETLPKPRFWQVVQTDSSGHTRVMTTLEGNPRVMITRR